MVYYNEHDPKAAAWLRENIKAGLVAPGFVDERSIVEVNPYELTHYKQHHFFAGIGGWSFALRLAGWPDGKRVATASCPCQPFSCTGLGLGEEDERHLWPIFRDVLPHLEASEIFGEQVASPDGREWLARVRADLEALGYAVGCADLCAAGVSAPQPRQRLYWLANANGNRWKARGRSQEVTAQPHRINSIAHSAPSGLEYPEGHRWKQWRAESSWWGTVGRCGSDGKSRRLDPSIEPLAYGIPNRVPLLRGSGNAIVPQLAATFIKAYNETLK